jgi:hypothetical protein
MSGFTLNRRVRRRESHAVELNRLQKAGTHNEVNALHGRHLMGDLAMLGNNGHALAECIVPFGRDRFGSGGVFPILLSFRRVILAEIVQLLVPPVASSLHFNRNVLDWYPNSGIRIYSDFDRLTIAKRFVRNVQAVVGRATDVHCFESLRYNLATDLEPWINLSGY